MAGEMTACAYAVASAASTADPPARKIAVPAAAAKGSGQTTIRFDMALDSARSGLAIKRAKLPHVGERAVAQPRDVAARVHELIPAREHVLPRAARMRNRAHRSARSSDARFCVLDHPLNLRVPGIAHPPHPPR